MRLRLTLSALIPLVTGCFTYPCETDVLACEQGDAFEVDPHCKAEAPLSIELIEMQTLEPVATGSWPIVHHGAQGGIHFDLGVQVRGLMPDHVAMKLDFDAAECRDDACGEVVGVARRTLNADDTVLEPDEDGFLLPDVVLLLERKPARGGELVLQVLDACGRELELVHAIE